jgi:prephenate dehydrogenase
VTTFPTDDEGPDSPRTSNDDRPTTKPANGGHATIVGTGLIGASIGIALRGRGWTVSGVDEAPGMAKRAVALGALDVEGFDDDADVVFVATPVRASEAVIRDILGRPGRRADAIVTDVGSVKGPLVAAVDHPSFVGGHPMAGSEQVGVDGANGDLFVGATWVLTPTALTDPTAYTRLRSLLVDLGANVVALAPGQHDSLVAVVSHVPHLTAATLMDLAAGLGEEHASLLQLAAGGFRDMTRVAAGQPSIWPDICEDNATAIVETLDLLIEALRTMRTRVADHDHTELLSVLTRAATARRGLAALVPRPDGLVEVRVPVPDRTGVLAEITTLAAELGVNLVDVEIAHSVEGDRGVLVLTVDGQSTATLVDALTERGYRSSSGELGPT